MQRLEKGLKTRPLLVTVVLALALCCALGSGGEVSEYVMPFGDGEQYVFRCLSLYGFLHSGQWGQFWNTFTLPEQSLAPLNYVLFFLLPQAWAGMTSYGCLQLLTSYGLLAFGAWLLCRTLERPGWTPALFILCATQNISLDESYLYFQDVPFLAVGMIVLGAQMRTWKSPSFRNYVLVGSGLGMLFWVKSANALIFTWTYFLAEIIRFAIIWWNHQVRPQWRQELPKQIGGWLAGFLPLTVAAMGCGAFQSIVRLIDANELSGRFVTQLQCTGVLRFFYFPLCLTFFYHTLLLLGIFLGFAVVAWVLNAYSRSFHPSPEQAFPSRLLWPLLIAYLILGEAFSFSLQDKEMRSMLLVLPVLWLATFWVLEKVRVRIGLVLLAALVYACCALSQVISNTFSSADVPTESYQLDGDWLERLPQAHSASVERFEQSRAIFNFIREALPNGGKVAVGSDLIYLTSQSLTWIAERDLALHGQHSAYQFQNFITPEGLYRRKALRGAQGIIVYLIPQFQYSHPVFFASTALVQFGLGPWQDSGFAQAAPLRNSQAGLVGVLVLPSEALDDSRIDELIGGTKVPELPPETDSYSAAEHQLSWTECRDILLRWGRKKIGLDAK
jgi:hypothetical protein